jgi:diguanylate cyclase (GGDEF)-like protein
MIYFIKLSKQGVTRFVMSKIIIHCAITLFCGIAMLFPVSAQQVSYGVFSSALISVESIGDGDSTIKPINKDVLMLVRLSENNATKAKQALKKLPSSLMLSLAPAEQYLIYRVQGNIAKVENKPKQAINYYTKALALEQNIPASELAKPLFFNLRLDLAESYAAIGDYDAAYEQKKQYLLRFQDDYIRRDNELIAALNHKYDMTRKAQENALLAQQNKLEKIEIEQVEKLQQESRRNTFIIIAIAIIFILIMIRQYYLRRQLVILARTDALTGLVNRKTLFYLGEKLVTQARKQKTPLSTILFDVDYFKKINDTYGHQVGDSVLIILSQLGNEVLRSRDIFARIGGEEFVIVLPEENSESAKASAEHLREKIAQYDFSSLGVKEQITASFGIATLTSTIKNFDNLIALADMAMYRAKSTGRNQVVCYENSFTTNPDSIIRTKK